MNLLSLFSPRLHASEASSTRRRAYSSRAGITLIEVVMVSALGVLLLGQVISVALSCQRAIAEIMANTELSITMRNLRDKLLFRLEPEDSLGLLGVPIDSVSSEAITFHAVGEADASERLSFSAASGLIYDGAEEDSALERRWLAPSALSVTPGDATAFRWNDDLDTLYLELKLSPHDDRYALTQRLAIPRFGRVLK